MFFKAVFEHVFCYMCSCFDVDVVEVAPVRGTKNIKIKLET